MKRSLKLLASFLFLLVLTNCKSFQASDFEVMFQLPASQDCYGFRVMSRKETRYSKEQCADIIKRAVFLTSVNYRMLRSDVLANCEYAQCHQITGAFDGLFLALDKGLQKIPIE